MSNDRFLFGGSSLPANFTFGTKSVQQQLEDSEVRAAQLELELERALEQNRLLGKERDTAKELARSSFNKLRAPSAPSLQQETMADSSSTFDKLQDLQHANEDLRKQRDSDTLTIEHFQEELQQSNLVVKEKESQIAKADEKLTAAQRQFEATKHDYERTIEQLNGQLEQLHTANEKLEHDVEDHKDNASHNESILSRAYAEQQNIREAYNALTRAKDDAEAQMLDLQLRYDSLFTQWQEDQEKIEELESREEQLAQYEADHLNMEADLARLHDTIAGHDRTIIVKDERIAHLEAQYQKERQRNLNAADAAADATVAAATSRDEEAPPSLSGLGDSLADELSDDYNEYDDTEFYSNERSEIFEVADITPIESAVQPLSIGMNENASVSPVDVPPQSLTIAVTESTSISPVEVVAPNLTLSINETGSVTPVERAIHVTSTSVQTDLKDLITEIVHAASIDTTPIAPTVVATTTISTQTEAPQLTSSVVDAASIDVAPTVPASNVGLGPITTTFEEGTIEAVLLKVTASTIAPITVTHEDTPVQVLLPEIATSSIAPVTVTHDETPIEARFTKAATTTAAVQTTETPAPAVETRIIEVVKPNGIGFLQAILPFIAMLLAFLSLWQYMQLQAWETANDYSYSTGSSYDHGGAYGNGRHFFGIPLAQDIGDNWWTERIANIASRAITGYEKWAGIEYVPTY
jgi:hypothetical protein